MRSTAIKYSGLLIDLDNTLYEYEPAHLSGMESMLNRLASSSSLKKDQAVRLWTQARERVKEQVGGVAASHNRLLYVQKLLESADIWDAQLGLELYSAYWDNFLESMQIREGAHDLLQIFPKTSVCIVTDLTAHIQHRKLVKLGLEKYLMVTSEEAGVEKPNSKIFSLALSKVNMTPDQVVMIGDDYSKDIKGANASGIEAIYVGKDQPSGVRQFQTLKEVTSVLKSL